MRLHIHLQPMARSSELPTDNYPLAAAVYRLLSSVAPEYAAFLHDEGFGVDGYEEREARPSSKRFKFFVFSRLAQRGKRIVEGRMRLNDSLVTWQIGSPMDEMMGALAESLLVNREVRIGDRWSEAAFQVAGIDVEAPPPPGPQLRGETLSPLFAAVDETDGAGKRIKHHVRADEARFGERLAMNLCEKYRALTGESADPSGVRFRFTEPPRSQLVQYRDTDHKCWMGRFQLAGEPALLRLAWEAGLGEANSKGFGMIRAI